MEYNSSIDYNNFINLLISIIRDIIVLLIYKFILFKD